MKKTYKDFKLEVEQLEPIDPFPPTYYVCSHGASVEYPILVNEYTKLWFENEGIKVYTRDEYIKLREKL